MTSRSRHPSRTEVEARFLELFRDHKVHNDLLDEPGQFLPEQTARPILRASHGGLPSRAEKILTAFRSKVRDDAYKPQFEVERGSRHPG